MQILPVEIAVSEADIASNPRAERLLSPNIVQIDTRAFKSKPAYADHAPWRVKVQGLIMIGLVVLAILAVNRFYQPIAKPAVQIEIAAKPPIIAPIPLEIVDVQLRKISINRKSMALVSGEIINRSGNKLPIPQLDIVLRRKDGHEVSSWRFQPRQISLKAGTSIHFTSKFSTDVQSGNVADIRFVSVEKR